MNVTRTKQKVSIVKLLAERGWSFEKAVQERRVYKNIVVTFQKEFCVGAVVNEPSNQRNKLYIKRVCYIGVVNEPFQDGCMLVCHVTIGVDEVPLNNVVK